MAKTFKLREVKEPKFEIEFAEGDVRPFDPWKMEEDIAKLQTGDNPLSLYDSVRRAVGLPTQAESDAAEEESDKKLTLTREQCHELHLALAEFISELPVSKKAVSLAQSLSGSTVPKP